MFPHMFSWITAMERYFYMNLAYMDKLDTYLYLCKTIFLERYIFYVFGNSKANGKCFHNY